MVEGFHPSWGKKCGCVCTFTGLAALAPKDGSIKDTAQVLGDAALHSKLAFRRSSART